MKKVIIVGGGFAGLNAAKTLGNQKEVSVTLIDRKNHHLFQPLLYQVAMAGLSPAINPVAKARASSPAGMSGLDGHGMTSLSTLEATGRPSRMQIRARIHEIRARRVVSPRICRAS